MTTKTKHRSGKQNKWYVVWIGRNPGIYSNWNECKRQVEGYPKAEFKSYATKNDAKRAFAGTPNQRMEFIDRSHLISNWQFESTKPIAAFVDTSNRWSVQVFPTTSADSTPWKGLLRVGINKFRNPGDPTSQCEIEDRWSVLQSIKEALFPGQLAIEVFPPANQVVDVAPMRWLWILPPGSKLPFSLAGGETTVG